MKYIISALVLVSALAIGSLYTAFHYRGKASAYAAEIDALQDDLTRLRGAVAAQAKTGAAQSSQRGALRSSTQAAAAAATREYPNEVRPRASPTQLERMQSLREAARSAAASAAVVP